MFFSLVKRVLMQKFRPKYVQNALFWGKSYKIVAELGTEPELPLVTGGWGLASKPPHFYLPPSDVARPLSYITKYKTTKYCPPITAAFTRH